MSLTGWRACLFGVGLRSMSMTSEVGRVTVVTPPVLQPLSLTQCRKQCEIGESDTTHDAQLTDLIDEVTDQWESDTDSCLMEQTLRVYLETWPCDRIRLTKSPVTSITSIKYYDDSNTLQTLSTSVYDLDAASREVRLKYDQVWPSLSDRWDAIEITYVAGNSSADDIPKLARRAMLLLIGYYFTNRGDNDKLTDMRAYESLVKRYVRSTYP